MKGFIKLDPSKPFKIPKGYRLGRVKINGEYKERPFKIFEGTTIEDDNNFIRKLQKRMMQRSIEWMKRKTVG